MSESDLQSAVIAALRRAGCEADANVVVRKGRRATGLGKGSPDVWCAIPGVYGPSVAAQVWFELKMPKGKQTPEQKAWQARAARAGVPYVVVRSVEEALATVNAIRFGRTG